MELTNQQTFKYHPDIDNWFKLVKNDEIPVCKEQKKLVKWLENILKTDEILIDFEEIDKVSNIPKAYFGFELYDWELFLNACLFGIKNKDGTLRFDELFLMIGRGAGKTGYFAWISFYMLSSHHGVKNYHIDLVANSEEQAKMAFEDIYSVLENYKSKLKNVFYWTKEVILHRKTGSKIKYNTSNAKTKDSKRTGCLIFDEYHAYEDYKQIKVFTSGLGKVPNRRMLISTTEGDIRQGPLDDKKNEVEMILNGQIENSTTFPMVFKCDNEEEIHDPNCWHKANPSIRFNTSLLKEYTTAYDKSRYSNELRQEFIVKRCNIVKANEDEVVASWEDILKASQGDFQDDENIEIGGWVDFSDSRDFVSAGFTYKKDAHFYSKQHSWTPKENPNLEFIKIDKDEAVKKGWLTIIPGKTNDPKLVAEYFAELNKKYRIKYIACDSWRWNDLKHAFEEVGLYAKSKEEPNGVVRLVRSGEITHSKVAPLIQRAFIDHTIHFEDDRLMRWYINNTGVTKNGKGNLSYFKVEPKLRKNDGFMGFVHGFSLIDELDEESIIDMMIDTIVL